MEVEPILSSEIFQQAQERLVTNKYRFNNNNRPITNHLFAGLVTCWVCWGNYKAYRERDKSGEYKVYYRCSRSNAGKHWDDRCKNSQVREGFLIEKIYYQINDIIRNPKNIIEKYLKDNQDKKEERRFVKELSENDQKIREYYGTVEELYDNLISERNPSFKEIIQGKIDRTRSNIEHLEARNEELKQLIQSQKDLVENSKEIIDFAKKMKGQDIFALAREDQIKFLNLAIKNIIAKYDTIDVTLKFESGQDGWGGWNKEEDVPPIRCAGKGKGLNPHKGDSDLTAVNLMVTLRRLELRFTGWKPVILTTRW